MDVCKFYACSKYVIIYYEKPNKQFGREREREREKSSGTVLWAMCKRTLVFEYLDKLESEFERALAYYKLALVGASDKKQR
jgi:hypothetical protein